MPSKHRELAPAIKKFLLNDRARADAHKISSNASRAALCLAGAFLIFTGKDLDLVQSRCVQNGGVKHE
jgi:hypothetical protein